MSGYCSRCGETGPCDCHHDGRAFAFRVEGPPVGKAKKIGMVNGHATGYNDAKTDNYQRDVRHSALAARPASWPNADPDVLCRVHIVAVFPRTAAMSKRSARTGMLLGGYPEGRIPHGSKPDFDNLAKSICDGMKGTGIWSDDARVQAGMVEKWYAATDETPHAEVTVERVE